MGVRTKREGIPRAGQGRGHRERRRSSVERGKRWRWPHVRDRGCCKRQACIWETGDGARSVCANQRRLLSLLSSPSAGPAEAPSVSRHSEGGKRTVNTNVGKIGGETSRIARRANDCKPEGTLG